MDYQIKKICIYVLIESITICCKFDINTETCDSSNYFSLSYGIAFSYDSGFKNDNKKTVAFLKYNDQMKRLSETISVNVNEKLVSQYRKFI